MAIYVDTKDGYVLKKDLIVFKHLKQDNVGNYYTSIRNCPLVKFNFVLYPNSKLEIKKYGHRFIIEHGIFHSYLRSYCEGTHKAIIPAGSRIWLQQDLTEVASSQIIISSDIISKPEYSNLMELEEFLGLPYRDNYIKLPSGKEISMKLYEEKDIIPDNERAPEKDELIEIIKNFTRINLTLHSLNKPLFPNAVYYSTDGVFYNSFGYTRDNNSNYRIISINKKE